MNNIKFSVRSKNKEKGYNSDKKKEAYEARLSGLEMGNSSGTIGGAEEMSSQNVGQHAVLVMVRRFQNH